MINKLGRYRLFRKWGPILPVSCWRHDFPPTSILLEARPQPRPSRCRCSPRPQGFGPCRLRCHDQPLENILIVLTWPQPGYLRIKILATWLWLAVQTELWSWVRVLLQKSQCQIFKLQNKKLPARAESPSCMPKSQPPSCFWPRLSYETARKDHSSFLAAVADVAVAAAATLRVRHR